MIFINININTVLESLLKGIYADAYVQLETETTDLFITTENGFLIGTD